MILVKIIQCSNKSCGHVLLENERDWTPTKWGKAAICPLCRCRRFYTLKTDGNATVMSERDTYRNGIDPTLMEPHPRMGPKKKASFLAAKERAIEKAKSPE